MNYASLTLEVEVSMQVELFPMGRGMLEGQMDATA